MPVDRHESLLRQNGDSEQETGNQPPAPNLRTGVGGRTTTCRSDGSAERFTTTFVMRKPAAPLPSVKSGLPPGRTSCIQARSRLAPCCSVARSSDTCVRSGSRAGRIAVAVEPGPFDQRSASARVRCRSSASPVAIPGREAGGPCHAYRRRCMAHFVDHGFPLGLVGRPRPQRDREPYSGTECVRVVRGIAHLSSESRVPLDHNHLAELRNAVTVASKLNPPPDEMSVIQFHSSLTCPKLGGQGGVG